MRARSRFGPSRRVGLLLAGSVLLALLGVFVTVVLPASEARGRPADRRRPAPLEARGARVYRSEGCWYCHTQQVRDARIDRIYGQRQRRGDVAVDQGVPGTERVGPDLSRVGDRIAAAEMKGRLTGRGGHSFGHLSDRELDALSAYLLSLK
ncbi:MAG TPA: cbb3-type cytochrome c oxidase subunit II [Actinomycetota bacterium]|nr:cbb3-type cytochrome c oxidase subunit II [Actinomycetota bacterium]